MYKLNFNFGLTSQDLEEKALSANFQKALSFYQAGEKRKAAQLLKKDKSTSFPKLKLQMLLESDAENYSKAVMLGVKLMNMTQEKVHLREVSFLLASCYSKLGELNKCEQYLEHSVAIDSSVENGKSMFELSGVYYRREKFEKLEKLAPKLLSWQKYHIPITVLLCQSAAKKGNKDLLIDRLKKASYYFEELQHEQFATLVNLMFGAKLFDLAEVAIRRFEEKHNEVSITQKANLYLHRSQTEEAVKFISKYDKDKLNNEHVFYLSGKIEEKKGNFDQAFADFSKGASIVKKSIEDKDYPSFIKDFNIITPKMEKILKSEHESVQGENVFIFGFPRSGTTLLDNILDTQKDALVLSERNIIPSVYSELKYLKKRYPLDLPRLNKKEICTLRDKYYKKIEEQGFTVPASGRVIEKGPHFTEMLPFIRLLFPESKLITTLRHPLDVCLSCFQINFEKNNYNTKLITFDDITDRYIEVFSLLERYQNELGIQPHFIRYEDLVTDIEGEMTKVFDYIGMTPDKSYLDFNKHASAKFVMSASRGQTDKALYTSSMYKWKNYEKNLAPYKEKLQYFIEKFGYDF